MTVRKNVFNKYNRHRVIAYITMKERYPVTNEQRVRT